MDNETSQIDMDVAFGKALRACRKHKGKTQEDFSVVSSRTYISQIERGLRAPTLKKIKAISEVLGVDSVTLISLSFLILDSKLSADGLLLRVKEELASISANKTSD